MVSPVAAAMCEVVCGVAPHAAHQAEAAPAAVVAGAHDAHAHHAPQPAPEAAIVRAEASGDATISIPAPECDLRGATPARLRPTSTDVVTSSAALIASVYLLDRAPAPHMLVAGATLRPPAPPPLTPLPLRI